MELQYESMQNRLNYIPEFLWNKLVQIHSLVVDATEKIDRYQNSLLKDDLEKEKMILEKRKKELKEKYHRKEIAAAAKLRELKDELREEEQSLSLILACIDGMRKKNEQSRDAWTHRQPPQAPPPHDDDVIPTPSQEFLSFDEEKYPNFANESMNGNGNHQEYDIPQQQPPWFRMVKRRKVTDEYLTTTREYKSATQILVEKEHEWSEVRYSSE
jgi:hypothetical protein